MSVHVFGIRHHGPGCARSLGEALHDLQPDIVLLEGPPDADALIALAGDAAMRPPVALLIYAVDTPARAAFFPFAEFSPEWVAIRYALSKMIPVRFIDLPQSIRMGRELAASTAAPATEAATPIEAADPGEMREDPIGVLAAAAGYTDRELWWEHQIEQRQNATGLFDAILEAMREVRARVPEALSEDDPPREAYMRTMIRAAEREGFARIAVVCGAWHAPVLRENVPAKRDQELLKGLPKVKVAATWIPWTYSRLTYRSGYGAGVGAPNWYRHLWLAHQQAGVRWIIDAARLLRSEDLDASSANAIEAFRLAEALAALRDLPMAGLSELNDGIRAVLCHGAVEPMSLIRTRLEIGDVLGEVPESIPQVPLQRDLEQKQKQLRLKPSTESKLLDLDLRDESGRARSRLLHQLSLLEIPWGVPQEGRSQGSGTFHEYWQLQWEPEFPLRIIEANVLGNSVESAAARAVIERSSGEQSLSALTQLVERSVLAELPAAIDALLERISSESAVAADLVQLMNAIEPLARVARYGNVRGSDGGRVTPVISRLFERSVVGLRAACSSLDDDAAALMLRSITGVQTSADLLEDQEMRNDWAQALRGLIDDDPVHGIVRGGATRLLFDRGLIDDQELHRLVRLNLNAVIPPAQVAAWLEGLMSGSGVTLLHHDLLWSSLDEWLASLDATLFTELLPLLRRSFSRFAPAERRQMGERIRRRSLSSTPRPAETTGINVERAARVLPVLARILGARND